MIILIVAVSIAGLGVYFLSQPKPALVAPYVQIIENEIFIGIEGGAVPAGKWEYSIATSENMFDWKKGNEPLEPPGVSLGEYSAGRYYVSLRHRESEYMYIRNKRVEIS
jgi:hypothetical protein